MLLTRRKTALFVLSVMAALTGAVLVPQSRADKPADPAPTGGYLSDVHRLSPEAAHLYAYVTTPFLGDNNWRQIPWLADLDEAVRIAKEEKRPLFLMVFADNPLERC
jgi:hypothetical protein